MVSKPAASSIPPFRTQYVHGLIGCRHKTVTAMARHGSIRASPGHAARQLALTAPSLDKLRQRGASAPPDAFLAVDLLTIPRAGSEMQGVDYVYDSAAKRPILGLTFVSSALVYPSGFDPLPLGLEPFMTKHLETETYPHRSPSKALLDTLEAVQASGLKVGGVVVDSQFVTLKSLSALNEKGVSLVGRLRVNTVVEFEGQRLNLRALAEQFPPGRARYYARFDWYAKRLRVAFSNKVVADVLLVWRRVADGRALFALVSTLDGGVQEVLGAWKSRWGLEVIHRLGKQNFGLGACQARSYSAQVNHLDLVLEAICLVRAERVVCPGVSWREAQARVAFGLGRLC